MKAGQDGRRQSWGDWTPTVFQLERRVGTEGRQFVGSLTERWGSLLVAASSFSVKSAAVPSVVSKEEW